MYRFEEADKEQISHNRVLNDGLFSNSDQMNTQYQDLAVERLGGMTSSSTLTAKDLGLRQADCHSPNPKNSQDSLGSSPGQGMGSGRKPSKLARTLKAASSEESADAPAPIASMGLGWAEKGVKKAQGSAKAKAAAKSGSVSKRSFAEGPGTTGNAAGGGSVSGQAKVDADSLLAECSRALQDIATTMNFDVFSVDNISSITSRLQQTTRQLAKKPKNTEGLEVLDALNKAKKKANALVELLKNLQAVSKPKKTKVMCKMVMHAPWPWWTVLYT